MDDRPLVAACMACTCDGAIALPSGEPLGSARDQFALAWLRAQADVLLIGAETARAEEHRPVRVDETLRSAFAPDLPAVAVVTRSGRLDLSTPFWDTPSPRYVVTFGEAPIETLNGVEVVRLPEDGDLRDVVAWAAGLGARRVLCEGGAKLFAAVTAHDLVDELFLTVTPWLASNDALPGLLAGSATPRRLKLLSCEMAGDEVLLRYRFAAGRPWPVFDQAA